MLSTPRSMLTLTLTPIHASELTAITGSGLLACLLGFELNEPWALIVDREVRSQPGPYAHHTLVLLGQHLFRQRY